MSNPWKTIKRHVVYENKFGYRLRDDEVITPEGKKGQYMVLEKNGFVVIVALTSTRKLLLTRQWRYTVEKEFLELPSGGMDIGESPLAAAKRELFEETGARSRKWIHMASFWTGNGAMKIPGHMYLAKDVEIGQEKSPDATEVIRVEMMDFDQAVEAVREKKFDEDRTIMGILLAEAIQ